MRRHFASFRGFSSCLKSQRAGRSRLLMALSTAVLFGLISQSSALAIHSDAEHRPFESMTLNANQALSYALFKANGSVLFSGELDDLEVMKAAAAKQRSNQGEYMVIRRDKQNYLIDDAALITKINNEWKPLEPFEQEMEQLSAQMEQHQLGLDIYQEELDTYLEVEGEVDEVFMAEFEARHKTFEKDIQPITARMEVLGEKLESLSHTAHANAMQMIVKALDSGVAKKLG